MRVLVIYDSLAGKTEKMARAIAEGASSVEGVEVELRKIGEPFPLSLVADFDLVAFGTPVIYADITDGLRSFLEHLRRFIREKKVRMEGKRAAVFGSYGYDGAWIMEERLRRMVRNLGYTVHDRVCVETATDLKFDNAEALERCRAFGREIAESLRG